jgi:DNA-binding transcriptional LysR family regulator
MAKPDLNDLVAFLTVAREGSFTKAAATLGISQPFLSQVIRDLEARLGVRLLARTTRSVAPTEAGARLVSAIAPDLEHIAAELDALSAFRDKPSGTIRISLGEHASRTTIWPKLPAFLEEYPDVKVELAVDHGLTDIVGEGFDAGVRLGERLAKDMIAVRIGPDLRMVVVGSPGYFATRAKPMTPRDLTEHRCINLRMRTYGGLLVWEFEKDRIVQNVRVDGQLVVNSTAHVLTGALAGLGLGLIMEDVDSGPERMVSLVRGISPLLSKSTSGLAGVRRVCQGSSILTILFFAAAIAAPRVKPTFTASLDGRRLLPDCADSHSRIGALKPARARQTRLECRVSWMLARLGGFHQPDLQPCRRGAAQPLAEFLELQRVEKASAGGNVETSVQSFDQLFVLAGIVHEGAKGSLVRVGERGQFRGDGVEVGEGNRRRHRSLRRTGRYSS